MATATNRRKGLSVEGKFQVIREVENRYIYKKREREREREGERERGRKVYACREFDL